MDNESLDILWMDDEPDNLVFELSELEDWGHCVTAAENLEDAIELIKNKKFDLILSDQQIAGTQFTSETSINLWMGCVFLRVIRKNFRPIATAHEFIQGLLAKYANDVALQSHPNENTYVAFISGFTNKQVIDEIKASSPKDHTILIFAKPIDENILQRVEKAAKQHKQKSLLEQGNING